VERRAVQQLAPTDAELVRPDTAAHTDAELVRPHTATHTGEPLSGTTGLG
jgi:hypothetical protein